MNLLKICTKIVEYCFYALFLLVPLAFTSATSELFELNKMWLTWGLTIIIGTSWFVKMILEKKFFIQRTPLDIPIVLFLLSQIISTIFSLDSHVSFWGYYSRFNGGLLSMISYIFLFYAFLSNSPTVAKVQRLMTISLISGLIVALWGLPSHFGYDPTCLLFRGTLDVSCWTADFMPTVRIFSTLGQPDWLAAYLAILIPIVIAFAIKNSKSEAPNPKQSQSSNSQNFKTFSAFGNLNLFRISTRLATTCNVGQVFVLLILFYVDLLYTRARSGILGIWISLIFFFTAYFWIERKKLNFSFLTSHLSLLIGFLLLITFVIGTPINQLRSFTLEGLGSVFQKSAITQEQKQSPEADGHARRSPPKADEGGTESADIRINVWKGAINAWKNNPIFGTGVETFAFAYYKYKPTAHNLTSEWNFLYNKAHNEYLNYLATTGIFGLGTYLLMIGSFMFISFKYLNSKSEAPNPKQSQNSNDKNTKLFGHSDFGNSNLFRASSFDIRILTLALLAGYISILITNFFGFSVVITNIYLFMIPAFVFALTGIIKPNLSAQSIQKSVKIESSIWQWTPIFFVLVIGIFMLISLFRFWRADIAFALGYNLDRAGEYQKAYENLNKAVELRGNEPVFKDEFSINNAIIAAGLIAQSQNQDKDTQERTIALASTLAQKAINTSNEIISQNTHNAVFWKTRTRVFYTLSQIDSRYLPRALDAIEKASVLAPADANIWYNLGVLYGQNNNMQKGIQALEKTVKLKPDYRDAHYALGLYYHTASLDTDGKVVVNEALNQKAITQMQYILDHLSPQDPQALESIKNWGQ